MDKRKTANKYLNKLKAGDFSVFDDFFRCFYAYIWEVGHYYLADKSYSDDVAQLTFETVLKCVQDFDDSKSGYAWMVEIAKNHALSFVRANKKYSMTDDVRKATVKEEYDEVTSNLTVHLALDKIDPHYKKILELYIFEDKTLGKIGEILNKSYYETFRDYHAALKELSEILKDP